MTTPTTSTDTLNRLLGLGDAGRTERSEDRPCRTVASDTHAWTGECVGANGRVVYRPRIKVVDGTSFSCSCPDHPTRRRGNGSGPCKHVLSLAAAALEEIELLALFERHI